MNARHPGLHALVLAAGASRRFGGIKLRARISGQPLLRRVAEQVTEVAEQTWVILGAHAAELTPLLAQVPVTVRTNPGWALGVAHSIRTGIEALPPSCTAAMVVLADQARLETDDYRRLAQTWCRAPETIVAARYGTVTGAPVIFPRRFFRELAQLTGDVGARTLLERRAHEVISVRLPNAAFDLDTPEDLAALEDADSRL